MEYMKWRSFRDSEDSRYVGLTLPHVLGREPYGAATRPTETFAFEEDVDGTDHKKYLWTNAVMLWNTSDRSILDARLVRGDSRRGRRRLVDGLPTHTLKPMKAKWR